MLRVRDQQLAVIDSQKTLEIGVQASITSSYNLEAFRDENGRRIPRPKKFPLHVDIVTSNPTGKADQRYSRGQRKKYLKSCEK
jgi:hypothetical protein